MSEGAETPEHHSDPGPAFQRLYDAAAILRETNFPARAILEDTELSAEMHRRLAQGFTWEQAVGHIANTDDRIGAATNAVWRRESHYYGLQYYDDLATTGLRLHPSVYVIHPLTIRDPELFSSALRRTQPPPDEEARRRLARQIGETIEMFVILSSNAIAKREFHNIPSVTGGSYPQWVIGNEASVERARDAFVTDNIDEQAIDYVCTHTSSLTANLEQLDIAESTRQNLTYMAAAHREGVLLHWSLLAGMGALHGDTSYKLLYRADWEELFNILDSLRQTAPEHSEFVRTVHAAILQGIAAERAQPEPHGYPLLSRVAYNPETGERHIVPASPEEGALFHAEYRASRAILLDRAETVLRNMMPHEPQNPAEAAGGPAAGHVTVAAVFQAIEHHLSAIEKTAPLIDPNPLETARQLIAETLKGTSNILGVRDILSALAEAAARAQAYRARITEAREWFRRYRDDSGL